MRTLPATVPQGADMTVEGPQNQNALTREIRCQVIPLLRNVGLMSNELPRWSEQSVTLEREQRTIGVRPGGAIAVAIAGRRGARWRHCFSASWRKLSRKYRAQVCERTALGSLAIDCRFLRKREALPENLEDTDQAECHPVRIQVRLTRLRNERLD